MKSSYSPIKLTIIIMLGFIMFGVFGVLYNKNSKTETWLVCNYPDKYDYYSEVIKFRYLENMYGYYREETFLNSTDMTLDEREEYFLKIEENLKEDDYFDYEVTNDGIKVVVKTYINASHYVDFFNDYIKDFNITNETPLSEVEDKMTGFGYNCTTTRK